MRYGDSNHIGWFRVQRICCKVCCCRRFHAYRQIVDTAKCAIGENYHSVTGQDRGEGTIEPAETSTADSKGVYIFGAKYFA